MAVHKNFPFARECKEGKSLEDKKYEKYEKQGETEWFQNETFHVQIKKNVETTSNILYNMPVIYFLVKLSGPLHGGQVEG